MLRDAGWHPGRRVPDAVERWRTTLTPEGFRLHAAAEAVLLEYGGLHIGRVGPGVDQARSDVELDPVLAAGEADRFGDFPELAGRSVFPLGEAAGGHLFLGIAETGEVYALMDEVHGRWTAFSAALTHLLLGIRQADV